WRLHRGRIPVVLVLTFLREHRLESRLLAQAIEMMILFQELRHGRNLVQSGEPAQIVDRLTRLSLHRLRFGKIKIEVGAPGDEGWTTGWEVFYQRLIQIRQSVVEDREAARIALGPQLFRLVTARLHEIVSVPGGLWRRPLRITGGGGKQENPKQVHRSLHSMI